MRLRLSLLLLLLARFAAAQSGGAPTQAPGASVSGTVRDSILRVPLSGAIVQIIAADSAARFGRTMVSDSLGRFTFEDVPDGRYMMGFFHPLLDSLGIDPPLRELFVLNHRSLRADLAVPSPARLRTAICGAGSGKDSGAVVVGVVRDAKDRSPVAGVKVSGEWLELTLNREGMVSHFPRVIATTSQTGWFAMCNVPGAGTMTLSASRGSDSTDVIEAQIPAVRFLRRDLYVGSARTVVVPDTTPHADTLTLPARRTRLGDGRLTGTVMAIADGRPLSTAQVSVSGGAHVRVNERGEWTLADAPLGTRMLEVRAVGYYPERRSVDVLGGPGPPIRISLFTMKAMLDTVRVTASRHGRDRNYSDFLQRRHSGLGHYVTADDIARQNPFVASDAFRRVPGLLMERDDVGDTRIAMRGAFGKCEPVVHINGMYIGQLAAAEIDTWVNPKEVAGIEIYSETTIPAQFRRAFQECGVILIWTKR